MKSEPKNVYLSIVGVIAFYAAAVIYLWKLIDEGARVTTAIPAVCLPIAAVLWTQIVLKLLKKSKSNKDEEA